MTCGEASRAPGNECGRHRRGDTDFGLTASFGPGERRVVFAQVTNGSAGQQTLAHFLLRHRSLAFGSDRKTIAGITPAEPPVGAVITRWPRAFSSEAASAQAESNATALVGLVFVVLGALPNGCRLSTAV